MALVKRQTSSSRLIVISVGIAVAAIIGFVLYRQLSAPTVNPGAANGAVSRPTPITNFGEAILNDSRYKDLKQYSGANLNDNVNLAPDARNPNPFQ